MMNNGNTSGDFSFDYKEYKMKGNLTDEEIKDLIDLGEYTKEETETAVFYGLDEFDHLKARVKYLKTQ